MNENVLTELKKIKFKKNIFRHNVSGLDEELSQRYNKNIGYPCHSFTFGPRTRKDKHLLSIASVKYPELYQLLKDYIKELNPDFKYTHITVNKNIVCKPHTDSNNTSVSLAIGLGEYTGGNLYVKGVPHNIRYNPVIFDGAQEHWTDEFEGERYSLIYYSRQ